MVWNRRRRVSGQAPTGADAAQTRCTRAARERRQPRKEEQATARASGGSPREVMTPDFVTTTMPARTVCGEPRVREAQR